MSTVTREAAAARLGIPADEVVDFLEDEAGLVITTSDGQSYIVVDEDHPDADGKTGLMFLAAPSETYAGGFPVFAQPAEQDEATDAEADATGGFTEPDAAALTAGLMAIAGVGETPAPKPARGRKASPAA